jgi:hypothetical protein
MTQFEFTQIVMQVTQICSGTEYRKAFQLMRRQGAERLARTDKSSDEYAAIRLVIGTWDRIATVANDFSAKQRQQFYRHHPIGLMWSRLETAINLIRDDIDPGFAVEFDDLHTKYDKWTKTKAGERYRTAQQQAINACFLI